MTLPFNTKETYLAWRARWRKDYADLSQTIRECKTCCNRSGREFYRINARQQLDIRAQSKIQSQACYLAAQAAKADVLSDAKQRQFAEEAAKTAQTGAASCQR
jgi:hypothetical protein